MTAARGTTPRGSALLIVLATLVLATTAATALLRLATTEHARRALDHRTAIADDLLAALDEPVRHWLREESATMVLPLDTLTPAAPVLDDAWESDGTRCAIRVTAYDQGGMVPIGAARSGSPLRLALPREARRLLDAVTIERGTRPGLDLYVASPAREPGFSVFPPPSTKLRPEEAPPPAFGALLATHHPGPVNVLTAPRPLVEAAMRWAGRGDLEQVLEARERGKHIELASPPRRRGGRAAEVGAVSTAWAMRIDIRVGNALRSWWAVYERSGNRWRCAQRLAITE